MSKKKKIIITASSIITVCLLSALTYAGNYFFNYALVRTEEGVGGSDRSVPSENQTQSQNNDLLIKDQNKTQEWYENTVKENISILSHDGLNLNATKYTPNPNSNNWVIIVHGYTSSQKAVRSVAMHYSEHNFNIITPDLRAHGTSDGKYIGMGWLDRKDIVSWVNNFLESNPEANIILHGISMGAATVMMTSSEDLPSNVKCIIEDCGYTSVYEIFSSELKLRFGLPSFPILDSASVVTKIRAGYGLREASAIEQVKKSKRPILFIHGESDKFVPVSMVHKLYDAATCKKDLLIVPNADHDKSRIVDPESYYNKVFEFINSNG